MRPTPSRVPALALVGLSATVVAVTVALAVAGAGVGVGADGGATAIADRGAGEAIRAGMIAGIAGEDGAGGGPQTGAARPERGDREAAAAWAGGPEVRAGLAESRAGLAESRAGRAESRAGLAESGARSPGSRAGLPARGRAARAPRPHAHDGGWYNIVPSAEGAAGRLAGQGEGKWYNIVPSAREGERTRVWGRRAARLAAAAAGLPSGATALAPAAASTLAPGPHHEFYFTRAQYTGIGRGWRGRGAWATDFPEADQHFVYGVRRLSYVDAYQLENPVRLDDPELRRYPFLYAVEVGHMALTDAEVEGLRSYLEAGGFLVVDDFWGPYEWENFEYNMRRVLPGRPIVDITLDHPLYSAFYEIDEIVQVPNVWNGRRGGPTAECWGCEPAVRGILDDDGRLMVLIHFNTDLGDAWEWADDPLYPIRYSTYAYQVGVNMIIYAMSH